MTPGDGSGRGGWDAIDDPAERAVLIAALVAGGVALLILATGHLSALLFNGGWPRYPLAEVPGIIGRAVTEPLDPGEAWEPVNEGTDPAGPLGWWFTLVLLVAAVTVPLLVALRAASAAEREPRRHLPGRRRAGRLDMPRKDPSQVVVGTAGGQDVALQTGHSLLVLGPMRSGKTSAVTIPAVLEWPGPVVATSTAGDFIDTTIGWRSRQGDVHVFDPTEATRHHPSGWSPLARATTWAGATRTAWDMAMAGKASLGASSGVAESWFSSAARSLAPYLLAAAQSSRTMEDVARWVDEEEHDDVLEELRDTEPDAAAAHAATFRREAAARSSLFHVMQQIVGAYLDPAVAASARRHEIEWAELLDGGAHTLYIVAPHHDRARVRPLFGTLVRELLGAVDRHVSRTHGPLDAPLLLVLDDAADIAPVEDLPTVAAAAGKAGVQVITVFHDLGEIEARYGDDAPAVVNNHRAKLLLPGAGTDAADLAGPRAGLPTGGDPTAVEHSLGGLTPDMARHLPADAAILLLGDRGPVRVQLRHWHKVRELRRRAGVAQDELVPPERRDRRSAATGSQSYGPSPIINPPPAPEPVDPAAFDEVDPETYLVPPHFPPNVSPLSAARERLRRRRSQD